MVIDRTFLVAMIGLLLLTVTLVASHESAHAEIFKQYGCETRFGMNFKQIYTAATCPDMSAEENMRMQSDNNYVDSFGYQFIPAVMFIYYIIAINGGGRRSG